MKISALEEYGLRCLLQLAKHPQTSPLSIPEIAEQEGLSVDYASKVVSELRKAGLVKSTRGTKGGFVLARTPETITVGEIVRVLGGPIFENASCGSYSGQLKECVHSSDCTVRAVWTRVSEQIFDVLDQLTLATLVAKEADVSHLLHHQPMPLHVYEV